MSLKLNVRHVDDVAIIDLSGRITLGEASGTLRDTIKDVLAQGNMNILLNLADVSYIDSSGLGEFVGGYATVTNRGGRMKLVHLQKRVRELMQITKLAIIFESFEDEKEAVRSFGRTAAAG